MITSSSPSTTGTASAPRSESGHATGLETDAGLLSRFVQNGDGSAFSKLVERHLSLVFGVASRRTESRELAQEAAQNTFCQLARHAARVRVRESLAPWLHKVALREAGTLLRSERSRQRTLQRLAVSVSGGESASVQPTEYPALSATSRAGEHLDEALASLPEPERRVIILRYLQGLSLRELASAESSSEEAVRKRVSRALDRLTALLARRGVTASAMMGCLTHVPLWPVPPAAAIADRAAKDAITVSASAGLAALVASCWPTAVVFLAAAIPAALPWGAGGPLSHTAQAPEFEKMLTAASGLSVPTKTSSSPGLVAGLRRELNALRSRGTFERDVRFSVMDWIARQGFSGANIDPAQWAATQRAVAGFSLDQVKAAAGLIQEPGGEFIADTLFARWAELAPDEARDAALALTDKDRRETALLGALRVMARRDPAGTLKWVVANAPVQNRESLLESLAGPIAFNDPRAYVRLMDDPALKYEKPVPAIPPIATDSGAGDSLCAVLRFDPAFALEGLRQKELDGSLQGPVFALQDLAIRGTLQAPQAEAMAVFGENLPAESGLRPQCLRAAAIALTDSNPSRAADLMAGARREEGDKDWLGTMTALLRSWRTRDPAAPGAWLAGRTDLDLDPEVLSTIVRRAGLRMPESTTSSPVVTP